MFSYMILALTVCLISCNPLENAQMEGNKFVLEDRSIKDSSLQLLKKLVSILKDAYQKGSDVFNKVLNDQDVQGLLKHMDGLTRRIAESIIQKFKDLIEKIESISSDDHSIEQRGFVETSKMKLERLTIFLFEEAEKGLLHFQNVIKDSDVQGMLTMLDPNDKKTATNLINNLKYNRIYNSKLVTIYGILKNIVCVRVGQLSQFRNPDSRRKRNQVETSKEKLDKLTLFLFGESRKGFNQYRKAIQSGELKKKLFELDPKDRVTAKKLMDGLRSDTLFKFKLVKIYEILKGSGCRRVKDLSSYKNPFLSKINDAKVKREYSETSTQKLERLTSFLLEAFEKGYDYFSHILEDSDVQGMLNHLDPVDRQTAIALMNELKTQLLERNDHFPVNPESLEKRDIKESSISLLKKLVHILQKAYEKGSKAFYEALENPDVTAILNSLNSLSRRIAETVINQFKELIEKVDEITNDDEPEIVQEDWKEDSKTQLKKLVHILREAYDKGSDYFNQVINDKDVKGILDHLGPLSRTIANKIIDGFKQLLEKIENAK